MRLTSFTLLLGVLLVSAFATSVHSFQSSEARILRPHAVRSHARLGRKALVKAGVLRPQSVRSLLVRGRKALGQRSPSDEAPVRPDMKVGRRALVTANCQQSRPILFARPSIFSCVGGRKLQAASNAKPLVKSGRKLHAIKSQVATRNNNRRLLERHPVRSHSHMRVGRKALGKKDRKLLSGPGMDPNGVKWTSSGIRGRNLLEVGELGKVKRPDNKRKLHATSETKVKP